MAPFADAGRGASPEADAHTDAHTRRELADALDTVTSLHGWHVANALITGLCLAALMIACWLTSSFRTIDVLTLVLMGCQLVLILVGVHELDRRPWVWSTLIAAVWSAVLVTRLRTLSSFTGHAPMDAPSVMALFFSGIGAVISWSQVPRAAHVRDLLQRFPELAGHESEDDPLAPQLHRVVERAQTVRRRALRTTWLLIACSVVSTGLLGFAAWRFSSDAALEPYGERFRVAWNSNRFDDLTVLARDSWRGECAAFLQHQVRKRHWEQGLPRIDLGKTFPQQNRVDFAYEQGDLQTFWTLEAGVWRLVAISLPK